MVLFARTLSAAHGPPAQTRDTGQWPLCVFHARGDSPCAHQLDKSQVHFLCSQQKTESRGSWFRPAVAQPQRESHAPNVCSFLVGNLLP